MNEKIIASTKQNIQFVFHNYLRAYGFFFPSNSPFRFPVLVFGALSIFCVFGCGANKITNDALETNTQNPPDPGAVKSTSSPSSDTVSPHKISKPPTSAPTAESRAPLDASDVESKYELVPLKNETSSNKKYLQSKESEITQLLNKAQKLSKKKKWPEAVEELSKLDAEYPDHPDILGELTWAAFNANDFEMAIKTGQRAMATEMKDLSRAAILYNMGRAEEAMGNIQDAIKRYMESLALRENKIVNKRLLTMDPGKKEAIDKLNENWRVYNPKVRRFSYQGKMVHPRCVDVITGWSQKQKEVVSLSDCTEDQEPFHEKLGTTATLRNESDEDGSHESVSYDVIAYRKNEFLIYTQYDVHMPLKFGYEENYALESLRLVELQDKTLLNKGQIYRDEDFSSDLGKKNIERGNLEFHRGDNKLVYSYNDGIRVALDMDVFGKTLTDICGQYPICLYYLSTITFTYDLTTKKQELLFVEPLTEYSWNNNAPINGCYEDFLKAYSGGNKIRLNPAQLTRFARAFAEKCNSEDARADALGGTWTDSDSGLMWQQAMSAPAMNWEDAVRYCDDLSLKGYDDWRLPNIEELISLIRGCAIGQHTGAFSLSPCKMTPAGCEATDSCEDKGANCRACPSTYGPRADRGYWPEELRGLKNPYWSSWSSTSKGGHKSILAWTVAFSSASVGTCGKGFGNYARCVRSVLPGATLEQGDGETWVSFPGGTFQMGSSNGFDNEAPVHDVTIQGFQMLKSEVTVDQFAACVQAGKCKKPLDKSDDKYCNWGYSDRGNHPVNCVDWHQATDYCSWIGGELPSEAQWEYAARSGGRNQKYPWGNQKATCTYAVMNEGGYGCGRDKTWPVCSKAKGNTAQGLCDMAGNVFEWAKDNYHENYGGAPLDGTSWTSGSNIGIVFRGGAWDLDNPDSLRTSFRNGLLENDRDFWDVNSGFRCVHSSP